MNAGSRAHFNDMIGRPLLKGALETLQARGVAEKNIEVAWVPGAWEIPVAECRPFILRHMI